MLAALSAGAIGLGAFAFEDLDNAISQEATQASLDGTAAPAELSTHTKMSEAAGLAALADFATATPTATFSPSPTATATPSPSPTATEVVVALATEPPPTETPVPPTETPEPPTATPEPPTATPDPPTATPEPPTPTPEPPTPTPTFAVPDNVPLLGEYVPPTATPTPTRTPADDPDEEVDADGPVAANATRYADSLEGNSMACGGAFDQDNQFVVAVSLAYDQAWKCGTQLEICGPGGCIVGVRTDTCPGCPGADIDMSRAGIDAVCGNQTGCAVTIRKVS